jgi:hypothetical protein
VKFRQFLQFVSDDNGFIPTTRFRWVIHRNPRSTAREEAIAAEVLRQANPRENLSGSYPWGPEETKVLEQLWIHAKNELLVWRPVPTKDAAKLYSVVSTEYGDLPIPNSIKQPGTVHGDFAARVKEILGQDSTDSRHKE